MAQSPSSQSCTLNIKYHLIGCEYVASHSSFAFSVRNKLLVTGTFTSCLVRTRWKSAAFCVHEWERERERWGESNTSDSNLFGARSASGSNAPLSACLASVLPPKMSAHRSGHSRVIRESCHIPLSPRPCREIERATLVRASSAQKQPPSPQLLLMETNSGETALTKRIPVIKHRCAQRETLARFFLAEINADKVYILWRSEYLCRQVGVVRKTLDGVFWHYSCSVSVPCKCTSIALIQTLVSCLAVQRYSSIFSKMELC